MEEYKRVFNMKGETKMETNEVMFNEEVMESATEIVNGGSGKGFKIAAGIGIAAAVGGLAYKFIAKQIIAKCKANKDNQYGTVDIEPTSDDCVEEIEETE